MLPAKGRSRPKGLTRLCLQLAIYRHHLFYIQPSFFVIRNLVNRAGHRALTCMVGRECQLDLAAKTSKKARTGLYLQVRVCQFGRP